MTYPDTEGGEEVPLLRTESLEAARDRFGSPIRPLGVASWVITVFIAALLIFAIVFISIARYARRENVAGILQPTDGAARITSARAGVITAVGVHEGQDVVRGQRLMTLALDPTISSGRRLGDVLSDASAKQSVAVAQQAAARREVIKRQRDEIAVRRAALLSLKARLSEDASLQQERVALAEQTARAARTLWGQQLMSAIQYRQREEALIIARQGLSAIEREEATIPSSLASLVAEDRRLVAEASDAAAALASTSAQLDEKRASTQAETEVVLVAQKPGQIAALQAKPGASVSAGQALAFVLPPGVKLQAELWAPSRAAGFVRSGDKVRLMYDAFPYQRFGVGRGTVVLVARAPTAPADLPVPMRTEESLYRILVALDDQSVEGYGQHWQLAPGMRLSADLVLEQQSLLAWLFDKVRATRARATPI